MRLPLIFGLLMLSVFSNAQPLKVQVERFIELTGEAHVELDPDIIDLSIELKEVKKKDHIIRIEEVEDRVLKILQKLGIPTENMKAYSTTGKQYDLLWRKSGLLISKRYTLKLTDANLFQPLLSELGDADLFSVSVRDVTHTEIEKYKSEVQLKAINDAKAKANLLVLATGSKLGQILKIQEFAAEGSSLPEADKYSGMYSSGEYSSLKIVQMNQVNLNQIKLGYKIKATFQID